MYRKRAPLVVSLVYYIIYDPRVHGSPTPGDLNHAGHALVEIRSARIFFAVIYRGADSKTCNYFSAERNYYRATLYGENNYNLRLS